jgi:hypothetical protein
MAVPAAVIVQAPPGAGVPRETPVAPSVRVYDPCATLNEALATPSSRATRRMGIPVVAVALPAVLTDPPVAADVAPAGRGAPRQTKNSANKHSSKNLLE